MLFHYQSTSGYSQRLLTATRKLGRLQHSSSSAPLQHPEHLLLVDVLLVLHPLWTADEGAYTPGICGVCRVKSVCLWKPKTWSDFVSQVCWFPLWAFARSFVFWQVLPRGGREVSRSYILRPYGPFRFQFQSRLQFRSIALVLYNVLLVCCWKTLKICRPRSFSLFLAYFFSVGFCGIERVKI